MATTLYHNGAGDRWLLVDGTRFASLGEGEAPAADRRVDLDGEMVMPGLINGHHHLYSALAGRLDWPPLPAKFTEILESVWWRLDRALDEEIIRASARLALSLAAIQGTTTIIDHHSSPLAAAGSLDILAEEAEALGLKIALALETSDRDGPDLFRACVDENLRALDRYAASETVAALFGLHAGFTLSDESLRRCAEATDAPFHLHCAEGPEDAEFARSLGYAGAVDRLRALGLLRPGSQLAHCVHLAEGEAQMLAEAGVFVVNCPQSNAHNGVGETDVPGLLEAGVRLGLGSDGFLGGLVEEVKLSPAGAETAGGQLFLGNALAASSIFGRPVGPLSPGADADFHTLDAEGRVCRTVSRGAVLYDAEGLRGWDLADLEGLAAEQAARLAERIQALEGP